MSSYGTIVRDSDFHADTRNFFKGTSVVVTGGSGFIGSHVVEQLLLLGAKPIILTRQSKPVFLQNILGQVTIRKCDLFKFDQTIAAIEGSSVVLNLAASVAGLEYNSKHPASIFQDNLQCFFNVIKAASNLKIKRLLVTSSACVYPRHCSIPTPESEGFLDEPEPTNSGYGWAKRMEEYLGMQYAKEFGLSVAIARPYNAYGPRDNFEPSTSHVIPALIRKAFLSKDGLLPVWGDGSHSRSFLYVDDFARGLLEVAARYSLADPINIGTNEETSIRQAASLISEIVGKLRGKEIVPVFDSKGLTGQPRRKCDTTKGESALGYKAKIEFQEGISRTVEWFNQNEAHSLL